MRRLRRHVIAAAEEERVGIHDTMAERDARAVLDDRVVYCPTPEAVAEAADLVVLVHGRPPARTTDSDPVVDVFARTLGRARPD